MLKRFFIILIIIGAILICIKILSQPKQNINQSLPSNSSSTNISLITIPQLRQRSFPGSTITLEKKVASTESYDQYISYYQSDGLKIYALLTIPKGQKPTGGWPVIVWNHGAADPKKYGKTNDDQIGKTLTTKGYLTFQPSYRGYATSDGDPNTPQGAVIDDLNAIASIKKYPDANGQKIGVAGHSMGGAVTLFDLVIAKDLKAASILAGDLTPLSDKIKQAEGQNGTAKSTDVQKLFKKYGTPESNPTFWNSLDPFNYLSDISIPVQLQAGTADQTVPWQVSENAYHKLKALGKNIEFEKVEGADHILYQNAGVMERTITFFNRHLK